MDNKQKNNVVQVILLIIIVIIIGFLVYTNFIKKKETEVYQPPQQMNEQEFYSKFNIDFLQSEVFKNLVDLDEISTSTIDEEKIGKVNPFLKF